MDLPLSSGLWGDLLRRWLLHAELLSIYDQYVSDYRVLHLTWQPYCCMLLLRQNLLRNNAILSDATIIYGLNFHRCATIYQAIIDCHNNEILCETSPSVDAFRALQKK